jgi:hypothetical protein
LAAICEAQEDGKAGRVISHDEMKKQVASCPTGLSISVTASTIRT